VSRSPARATQADIARAIRAIAQTGVKMAVEIDKEGTIRIVPVESGREKAGTVYREKEIIL
jgi:hypothetical protein